MLSSSGPSMNESSLPKIPLLDMISNSTTSSNGRSSVHLPRSTSGDDDTKMSIRLKPRYRAQHEAYNLHSSPKDSEEADEEMQFSPMGFQLSNEQSFYTPKTNHRVFPPAAKQQGINIPSFPTLSIPQRLERNKRQPLVTLKPRFRSRTVSVDLTSRAEEGEKKIEPMPEEELFMWKESCTSTPRTPCGNYY